MEFPVSQVFTWTPCTSSTSDILDMEQKLYLGSGFPPIDWEVVIQFKRSTVAQVDKNAGKKGLYLIQFKDSLHTAVVGTECAGIEDVLIGSYDVGEIVSNTSDLTLEKSRRNHWTCYGKRFIVSNCVISVGFITCPHTETRPVLEIVYSPLEGESILATVEVINEQIAMLAEELIPRGSLSTKKCLCSDAQFINIGSMAHRSLQYLHIIGAKTVNNLKS